ncbi:hypothetical protein EUX98_g1371 [Antrodiella citrinella]|uniref:Integrase catalytic domain-containing protein n=1 Tax=Antrodiella citrinella TaxID=2447956 RepID=A0A4S4N1H9_9APHY|nr:hypothetical protein EUX98_g1371 [Antrodiella citrinella]
MTCKRSKPNNQKPYGLLNPLKVPTLPWEAIGIDFVGPLPESKDRDATYDSITVIIDLLTAMVHLVPSRINYKAKQVAELVFSEVYKHHGLPKAIISDRDVLFTSTFWSHLHRLMGVELRMSSAYHPESDGSTERANRTVTQMLRQCIGPDQRDWVMKLPAVEFAINLARSDSTGYAPFFLNTGRMPRSLIWNNAGPDEYPAVRAYAQKVKYAVMAAHDSILAARVKQTRDANRRRRPVPFIAGDLVYVASKNMSLPKGLARKFIPKFIGPYRITQSFGNNSFRLDLPPNLKRRGIHDVFHSSLLRAHEPNDDRLFPGRLDSQVAELPDQDEEWAIEKIVAHRGTGETAVFETIWKSGDRTWVPYPSVAHVGALAAYLEAVGIENIGDLPNGVGLPPLNDPQVFSGSLEFATPCETYIMSTDMTSLGQLDLPFDSLTLFHSPTSSYSLPIIHFPFVVPVCLYTHDPFLTMHAPSGHAYFTHNIDGTGAVLARDLEEGSLDEPYLYYASNELRSFSETDSLIRSGRFNPMKHELPAGYSEFAENFNRDKQCRYGFAIVEDRRTRVVRAHLDIDILAPLSPMLMRAQANEANNDLRDFIVNHAVRQGKREERGRLDRLARKNTTVARGTRGPTRTQLDDSARQKGKRTAQHAHRDTTDASASQVAGPSSSGSTETLHRAAASGSAAGEDISMETDKDAEGEPEEQLGSFSDTP